MAGDTQITVVGNVARDPELKYTPSGVPKAEFQVGSTPRSFDRQAGEWKDGETLWLRCNVWRAPAENVAATLTRGMRVIVYGRLKANTFTGRDGDKRTVFEVDVDEVGPSLRHATATVDKATRSRPDAGGAPATDPWAASGPTTGGGFGASHDQDPPF